MPYSNQFVKDLVGKTVGDGQYSGQSAYSFACALAAELSRALGREATLHPYTDDAVKQIAQDTGMSMDETSQLVHSWDQGCESQRENAKQYAEGISVA